jgi:hypothetical protein
MALMTLPMMNSPETGNGKMSQNLDRKWSDLAERRLERVQIFVKSQNRHHWWLNLLKPMLKMAKSVSILTRNRQIRQNRSWN